MGSKDLRLYPMVGGVRKLQIYFRRQKCMTPLENQFCKTFCNSNITVVYEEHVLGLVQDFEKQIQGVFMG